MADNNYSDSHKARDLSKTFGTPKKTLGNLDAEAAGALIGAAADISLVIDRDGVICDIACNSDDLLAEVGGDWTGKLWRDTVTIESRLKIEALLRDAASNAPSRWRQVNHPARHGPDIPIVYSVVPLKEAGRLVAIGRDLRALETLQQRLMDVEQSIEREYSRVRHAETRYRLLFQIASEAVLIVDAATHRVIEANPAAMQLLEAGSRGLVGRTLPQGFDAKQTQALEALLAAVSTTGRGEEVRVRLAGSGREFLVTASLFRQENASHFLIRLRPADSDVAQPTVPQPQSKLLEVLEQSPDGLVVTAPDGSILTANRAFLDLAQLATAEQVRGQPLDRWLGRPGVDVRVLISNVRLHGHVRLFATSLRGEYGASSDVEVSAVSALQGAQPCLGFTVRSVQMRATVDVKTTRELPRSAAELTELIGRVSLKDLVRETTDVIERLCIEAALELTGDNRATAAEMLGLSRQSLYAKLRRHGLGDLAPHDEG